MPGLTPIGVFNRLISGGDEINMLAGISPMTDYAAYSLSSSHQSSSSFSKPGDLI